MHKFILSLMTSMVGLTLLAVSPLWACDLTVESAWIREAPPNVAMLAGYAVLKNVGNKSLRIAAIESPAFASIEMHESMTANGMTSMRAMSNLVIAAGDKVNFSPNGKHLMLMGAKQALKKGDVVVMTFKDDSGCMTIVNFKVGDSGAMDKAMEHSMPMAM